MAFDDFKKFRVCYPHYIGKDFKLMVAMIMNAELCLKVMSSISIKP